MTSKKNKAIQNNAYVLWIYIRLNRLDFQCIIAPLVNDNRVGMFLDAVLNNATHNTGENIRHERKDTENLALIHW